MKKLSTKALGYQLSVVIIVSSIFLFAYFTISRYNSHIDTSKKNVLEKLHSITKTLAVGIDWQEHGYITAKYLEKDGIETSKQDLLYYDIHSLMLKVKLNNNLETDIYTLFLDDNKELTFGLTSGETPYYRHSYSSAPKEIKLNFEDGAFVGPYMDDHGTWLSAFAPIKDYHGKTIAVVQADMMFDNFIIEARNELRDTIIISFVFFVIVISIVLYFVRRLSKIDEEKSKDLALAFSEVKSKNKDISDSINYAKRIQQALIPKQKVVNEHLSNSFMFYEPKDVVSGDFPWFYKKGDYAYLAAVDCTGHGVPGAMMSVIGHLLLNDIINNDGFLTPSEVLNKLHSAVVETLKQDSEDGIADGMDLAMCRIDLKTNEVLYSGAHRPLYLLRNKEIEQFKGDKYPIGGVQYNGKNSFSDHKINPKEGESIFFFSDGLPDQFNVEDRKFGPKRIRNIISEMDNFEEMENKFRSSYFDWKGDVSQTDDILLIGIKF